MAGVKISALPAVTGTTGVQVTDSFAGVQGGVTVRYSGYHFYRMQIAQPAYSASVTLDASTAEWFQLIVTNTSIFTLNAPANPPGGFQTQDLYLEVLNSSGGAMGAITFTLAFALAGLVWVNPANTKKRNMHFRWNGSVWVAISFTGADY